MRKWRRQVYAFPSGDAQQVTPRVWQQWLRSMADEISDNPWVENVSFQFTNGPLLFGPSNATGMVLEGKDPGE